MGVLIGVVFVLFYTSSLRANEVKDERTIQDFYHKTVNGLKHKQPPGQAVLEGNKPKAAGHVPVDKDADGDVDADDEKLAKDMQGRLKAAEDKAKELANKKSPLKPDAPSDVVGKGNSAAGQKKKEKTANGKEVTETDEEEKKDESDEEHAVEVELNSILKKSPGMLTSILPKQNQANQPKSSSFPSRTALTRRRPRHCCSKSTRSNLHHTSSNWISILLVPSCRRSSARRLAGRLSPISWSIA